MEQTVTYLSMSQKFNHRDFSVDNMKNTGFYGHDYDFSVDYYAIAADDSLDFTSI